MLSPPIVILYPLFSSPKLHSFWSGEFIGLSKQRQSCSRQERKNSNRYFSLPILFHTTADKAAPAKGATINNHNCVNAFPPSKRAGPMLRAGFTEVPVIGIQTICTNTNVSPIAKPHITGVPFLSSVTPKTTSTKMKVKIISEMYFFITTLFKNTSSKVVNLF